MSVCYITIFGFAAMGWAISLLFNSYVEKPDRKSLAKQIAWNRNILARGQRRVQQVESVAIAVLQYDDGDDGHEYAVYFCDLGDGTALCLHGDVAVREAVGREEFPCLQFERLSYPDSRVFDVIVARSEPVEPAYEYDWEEQGDLTIPKDGAVLRGANLAILPAVLKG
ncbi:MAG: hypothetical protein H7145_22975 [Akkermansiaceae bacterium]|nr:hypothetical protein [Armatimonadota bacterium]